jgi:hypothetical protein
MPDLTLKLDHAHAQALLAARKSERTKLIERNDWSRKLARKLAELPTPAQDSPGVLALKAKVAEAQAAADTQRVAFDAAKATAKAAHGAAGAYAEELFDPAAGTLKLIEVPEPKVTGRVRADAKRLALADAQCDEYAASYAASCAATDDAFDLGRQIEDYKAAHPDLFATGPGEPPPVDPAYEALKTALDAALATVRAEHERQGAIVQAVLAGEDLSQYGGMRISIATGEVVLVEQ